MSKSKQGHVAVRLYNLTVTLTIGHPVYEYIPPDEDTGEGWAEIPTGRTEVHPGRVVLPSRMVRLCDSCARIYESKQVTYKAGPLDSLGVSVEIRKSDQPMLPRGAWECMHCIRLGVKPGEFSATVDRALPARGRNDG